MEKPTLEQKQMCQLVKLDKPFRGFQTWHRYSDEQIEALRKWILWIGERDSIDVRKGLVEEVKKKVQMDLNSMKMHTMVR